MPKFSILLSVYNGEVFLRDCLDSCLNQSFSNFEVVAVDDGSVDSSREILDSYALKDNRIRVFHKENSGVFLTRRFAENEARGDYLIHADCDDLLSPDMLSSLYEVFSSRDPDVVFFDILSFFPNGETVTKTYFDSDTFFEDPKQLHSLLLTSTFNSLCHKCFRRKLVSACPDYEKFSALSHGEDLLRSAYLILNCESVYYLKKPLYLYRRDVGASSRFSEKIILDADKVTSELSVLITKDKPLFYMLCRKQVNNYIRLLLNSNISFPGKRRLLRSLQSLSIFKNASLAEGDSALSEFRFRLTEKGLFGVVVLLQHLHGKD